MNTNYEVTNLKKFGKESVLEFIQDSIQKNDSVSHLLDKIQYVTDKVPYEIGEETYMMDRSSQGFYYERLWDLCIKFGVTDLTLPSLEGQLQTSHILDENPNESDIEFQKNCWKGKLDTYLSQSVRSGSSGGYSDITFIQKQPREELYFISVKYFKEEKEIGDYDIGKLCALIRKHEKENRTIKLYIFLKNKKKAIEKFSSQRSSSNVLINYINPGGKFEHIYDMDDLQHFYFKLKKLLEQYHYLKSPENRNDFEMNYLNILKGVFIPRFHQKLFILKLNELMKKHKNILVGAIPRSGKSYIMAGTILDCIKSYPNKKFKFLMMTPAPNETFGEYNTIFKNSIDFQSLKVGVKTYQDDVTLESLQSFYKEYDHSVIIISKQKLGWSTSKAEKLLEHDISDDIEELEIINDDIDILKKNITRLLGPSPDIDVMFLDEAHFGMSTEKAKKIVSLLDTIVENTVKIYVTATYNKPIQAYDVNSECKLTWNLDDIEIMKTIDSKTILDNNIKNRFGEHIYHNTLEYFGDKSGVLLVDSLRKEYASYPKPHLMTSVWDKDFLNMEKLKIGDTEFGWDMNKLFATGDSDQFINVEQMKEMMRYYFGYPEKEQDYDKQSFYRTRGILPRIRNICLNQCRTLQQMHKTTQLWFLPLGTGKIQHKINALVQLLTNTNEFKDIRKQFHFFVAVEDKKKGKTVDGVTYMKNPREIKKEIESVEKKIREGKILADQLIILAGQRLQLGISLQNVDIVTLWNSISSSDAIFQMLFRSMTEVETPSCNPNEFCNQKKFGFMVDMNPQRTLTTVNLFNPNVSKNGSTIQKYRQITDLINIDNDVLLDKYGESEEEKNKFAIELFNKLYSSWDINVDNIKNTISHFSFDLTKLEGLKEIFKSIYIEKVRKETIISEPTEDESIQPGTKKMKETKKDKKSQMKEGKEINVKEIATEVISEFISLLNIFTLYTEKETHCILSDKGKQKNSQITIIDDIDILKNEIYKDERKKEIFLKILNGRLTGDNSIAYPEEVVELVLKSINDTSDKNMVHKIIITQKKQYYTIHDPKELLEYINNELKPKEKEKKEYGEVFTPLTIVNEMLDKLDESYKREYKKSIFSEPHITWFDPSVGIGNFPIILYERLMLGLEHFLKDEESRRKHILEKMIYMSELNPKNVIVCQKIFCGDTYQLNLYEGDTLMMDPQKIWNIDKFDIIIGNPPYNRGGIHSHTGTKSGKTSGKKNETIWPLFIKNSFDWLKKDGFLVFINPLSWLKKSHSLHNRMIEKHISWLKLWDDSQSLAMINADIPISLYVLKNTPNTNKKTEIISEIKRKKLMTTSLEYLNPEYSIPFAYHSIFNKLIHFIEKNNCKLDYKTKAVNSKGEIRMVWNKQTEKNEEKEVSIPLPKTYTLEDRWAVDTYTINEGIMVKKATEQHPDANKRKLIIANKRGFNGAFIDEGKLSITGNHKFYILGDNLELLLKLLSFKISGVISDYTKYGQSFLDNEAFKFLPDIRKLGMDITEDEFYHLLELTESEIKRIKNNTIKDEVEDVDLDLEDTSVNITKKLTLKNNQSHIQKNMFQLKPHRIEGTSLNNTTVRINKFRGTSLNNTLKINKKERPQPVRRGKTIKR